MVTEHAAVFRDFFDHHRPCQPCQPSLTGLIILPNKCMATIARGICDSPDKTHVSRVLAAAA
jgi:hypothetical protein